MFVKSTQGDSAEDQLLVQFQGMIAEYERAQILEHSRRGKRDRTQAGDVSAMSGAPTPILDTMVALLAAKTITAAPCKTTDSDKPSIVRTEELMQNSLSCTRPA